MQGIAQGGSGAADGLHRLPGSPCRAPGGAEGARGMRMRRGGVFCPRSPAPSSPGRHLHGFPGHSSRSPQQQRPSQKWQAVVCTRWKGSGAAAACSSPLRAPLLLARGPSLSLKALPPQSPPPRCACTATPDRGRQQATGEGGRGSLPTGWRRRKRQPAWQPLTHFNHSPGQPAAPLGPVPAPPCLPLRRRAFQHVLDVLASLQREAGGRPCGCGADACHQLQDSGAGPRQPASHLPLVAQVEHSPQQLLLPLCEVPVGAAARRGGV